ncbi:MAG: D-aminoacylase [Chloroflexi bacterium]|nr:D-aminoacylase [Chloroflexota bacterium]
MGVEGDRLKLLRGDTPGAEAARVLDATGRVVCPGFIDTHAHSGLMALHSPGYHEPKVRQGVTTELVGVDGNSYAPFPSPDDLEAFALLNAGLDGRLPAGLRWSSVAEYLEAFEGRVACNIAYVIGNSALRIAAVGWENRRPTASEAARMHDLLRQGMREGAFGMSTGLTYPPGSYAETEELAELCRTVNPQGGVYVTHVRYTLGDRILDPFREAIEIGRRSGVPVHISHLHSPRPGGARRLLALVDEARLEGRDVTFDSYSYPYSSTRLVALIPEWAHEGGTARLLERLRVQEIRARIAADPDFSGRDFRSFLVTAFTQATYKRFDGMSLAAIAEALGLSVVDTLCDLLLEEDLGLSYTALGGNPLNIREFYRHPAHMVGSDALLIGDHPNPRSYGCYPLVLGDFCREEGVLDLPSAVRKMTSFPAQRLGLSDRGMLRDGMKADMVVLDPQRVRATATLENPRSAPEGIEHVMVNGVLVVESGKPTGALPGRALRHGS